MKIRLDQRTESLPKGSSEQAFEAWNEYRIRDFRMKMYEPHLTLRQAQGEDLILSWSKHKVRDKESRFLKCRIRLGSAGDDVCSRALPRNAGPSPPAAAGRATTKKYGGIKGITPGLDGVPPDRRIRGAAGREPHGTGRPPQSVAELSQGEEKR